MRMLGDADGREHVPITKFIANSTQMSRKQPLEPLVVNLDEESSDESDAVGLGVGASGDEADIKMKKKKRKREIEADDDNKVNESGKKRVRNSRSSKSVDLSALER